MRNLLFLFLVLVSCSKEERINPPGIEVNVDAEFVTFAAIGDYGYGNNDEYNVSVIVKSANPDFIITMGDNNYEDGEGRTLNKNIGDFYCDYIFNFDAQPHHICNGLAFEDKVNRFFPTIGNHDVNKQHGVVPYLNYFSLPGNERFYDFIWGPVHFYAIDSTKDIKEQIIRTCVQNGNYFHLCKFRK